MKIAQIAPLMESCPPRLYGGTERIVSFLTEELVRQGHDVTLFASGDSHTSARLEPCCEVALRLDPRVKDPIPYHVVMLDKVRRMADEFDVLHFHVDVLHYPLIRDFVDRTVTTLHGRLDLEDLRPLYSAFSDAPRVSISDNQRKAMPAVNWAGTVYHGLPRDLLPYTPAPKTVISPSWGEFPPRNVPTAPLRSPIASAPSLRSPPRSTGWTRPIGMRSSSPWSRRRRMSSMSARSTSARRRISSAMPSALLFPIDWLEPFGMVMIEAMSCGTPVIAFRCGSTEEVIDHGVSGFLVDDLSEAVAAAERIGELDRAKARAAFERRFTIERVAFDYMRDLPQPSRLARCRSAGSPERRIGSGVGCGGKPPRTADRAQARPADRSCRESSGDARPAERGADGLIRAEAQRGVALP